MSSLSALAGRWITSPAAMRLMTAGDSGRMTGGSREARDGVGVEDEDGGVEEAVTGVEELSVDANGRAWEREEVNGDRCWPDDIFEQLLTNDMAAGKLQLHSITAWRRAWRSP
jgi:hypothetical protein